MVGEDDQNLRAGVEGQGEEEEEEKDQNTSAPGMNSGSVEVQLSAFADRRQATGSVPLSTQVDNHFAEDPEFIPGATA